MTTTFEKSSGLELSPTKTVTTKFEEEGVSTVSCSQLWLDAVGVTHIRQLSFRRQQITTGGS